MVRYKWKLFVIFSELSGIIVFEDVFLKIIRYRYNTVWKWTILILIVRFIKNNEYLFPFKIIQKLKQLPKTELWFDIRGQLKYVLS